MKKIIILVTVLLFLLSFCACGNTTIDTEDEAINAVKNMDDDLVDDVEQFLAEGCGFYWFEPIYISTVFSTAEELEDGSWEVKTDITMEGYTDYEKENYHSVDLDVTFSVSKDGKTIVPVKVEK